MEYKNYINVNDDYSFKDYSPVVSGDVLIGYTDVYDEESIKNSLKNIFLVQKNELPGKPKFGNPLELELFENFNEFTENTMKEAIKIEVEKYEHRITLDDVIINQLMEYNRIIVELKYTVNIKEGNIQDSVYLPFSANNFTYLSGRTTQSI